MHMLKLSTTFKGIAIPEAYASVGAITINSQHDGMVFVVIYSIDSAGSGEPFKTEQYTCPYDVAGDSPVKQAYRYLVSLPEFSQAIPV